MIYTSMLCMLVRDNLVVFAVCCTSNFAFGTYGYI